jgi:hypothetical protein
MKLSRRCAVRSFVVCIKYDLESDSFLTTLPVPHFSPAERHPFVGQMLRLTLWHRKGGQQWLEDHLAHLLHVSARAMIAEKHPQIGTSFGEFGRNHAPQTFLRNSWDFSDQIRRNKTDSLLPASSSSTGLDRGFLFGSVIDIFSPPN